MQAEESGQTHGMGRSQRSICRALMLLRIDPELLRRAEPAGRALDVRSDIHGQLTGSVLL